VADRYTFTGKDGIDRTFIGDRPPTPAEMADVERADSGAKTPDTSNLSRLVSMLPTAGGMVGGMAGGIPGAALGGAAGEGYGQLATHATELPGAMMDVLRNLGSQPAVATLKGAAQGAGQGFKDSGIEGGLQALYELGGRTVTAGLSTAGRAVYRGYLKPSLAKASLAKAGDIVETGIREAIPVTEGGVAKVSGIITDLRAEADRILANTTGEVDLHTVADKLRAWGQRLYNRPGRAPSDLEAVMKVADRIDNHPSMIQRPPLAPVDRVSATAANQAKRDMQAGASTSFGVKSGAEKTAEKVGASYLRQGVEDVAPAVGPINARESQLIDLAKTLNKATGREANRNQLFGVPTVMADAGAGRYGAGAMALAVRMGLTPNVATQAAILAAKMGDTLPGTAVADVARIAVQAVSQSQQ
jgi:hypothetical protein